MILHEEQFLISIASLEALPSKSMEQMEAFCSAVARCCVLYSQWCWLAFLQAGRSALLSVGVLAVV